MIHCKKRFTAYDICFFISLAAAAIFLIWKCRYGYGAGDEPFYLTLAQRLADGDALLSQEWNLSQLSGFLLLPFYRIYRFFFTSTDGIVLHFRYLYVLVQALVCLLLYGKLRRFRFGGVIAVLLFCLYTPYDIMALSYNTMSLMTMTLCLVFLACNDTRKCSGYLWAGLFYALAVLCHPYLIFLYVLYLIVCVCAYPLCMLLHRGKESVRARLHGLLFFTVGAAIPAILLLLFILSRAGFSDVLINLKELLYDPDHSSRSLYSVIYGYFYEIFRGFGTYFTAWAVVLCLALLDRKRHKNAWMYFCMTALLTALAIVIHLPSIQTDYNYIMFPVSLCGLTSYVLTGRKNHSVFFRIWCTGILYTFCLSWASNQGLNAICMGMPLVMIASVILIYEFLHETYAGRQASSTSQNPAGMTQYSTMLSIGIALLLLCSQLVSQCYAKSVHAFWEPSVSALTETIYDGPLKGVRTTKEHANAYETRLSDISSYKEDSGPVLFLTSTPWCYLYADREYGTYSSWLSSLSTADPAASAARLQERLGRYYELHPDKLPTQIYIAKNDLWDDDAVSGQTTYAPFSVSLSSSTVPIYSVTETEYGYHLVQISVK